MNVAWPLGLQDYEDDHSTGLRSTPGSKCFVTQAHGPPLTRARYTRKPRALARPRHVETVEVCGSHLEAKNNLLILLPILTTPAGLLPNLEQPPRG